MAIPLGKLIQCALAIVCMLCMRDILAEEECYLNGSICLSNDLACWTGDTFPGEPDTLGLHFFLYTNTENREIMWDDVSTLEGFDAGRKTVVIAHGFESDYQDSYISRIRTAFLDLEQSNVNVIMVDWEVAAAGPNYWQCRVDSRLVARLLGILLQRLHENEDLDYTDVHMVGHSLGAHLVGFTGAYLDGQIGRITGLDPASPEFKDHTDIPDCVLDKTDAQFVDIIHSDGSLNLLGLAEATGDEDFYPNKGNLWQTDCFFKFSGCGHMRSIDFFVASLKHLEDPTEGCDYPTVLCGYDWKDSTCAAGSCPKMGIEAAPISGVGPKSYCLETSCYDE